MPKKPAFVFKPGPPKPVGGYTLAELRKALRSGARPLGAKSVGGGIVKVLTARASFYVRDGKAPRALLAKEGLTY